MTGMPRPDAWIVRRPAGIETGARIVRVRPIPTEDLEGG
jgi:hypothetical protein